MAGQSILRTVISKMRAPTEFERAQQLAAGRATLPAKQGGLNLKPGNTAMERAAALKFDLERPGYHASLYDIKEVDPSYQGPHGFGGKGFYTTPDRWDVSANYASPYGPDRTVAILVALENAAIDKNVDRTVRRFLDKKLSPRQLEKVVRGTGQGEHLGAAYPVLIKHGREANLADTSRSSRIGPAEVPDPDPLYEGEYLPTEDAPKWTKAGRTIEHYKGDPGDLADAMLEGAPLHEVARTLRKAGRQRDIYDPDTGEGMGPYGLSTEVLKDLGADTFTHPTNEFPSPLNVAPSHTVVLKPENVRSKFAAFDPWRTHERNLLAGVGGGSVGVKVLLDALRQRNEDEAQNQTGEY